MVNIESAARLTGWHKSQVSRWVKRLGFGRRKGDKIELTDLEVAALIAVKKAARPGNRKQ